ncbi:MAG: hypothetical protein A4E30_00777 [Methanomassiliicoccales archaeon PtaB.Bin215]|nr:MAG: hypothetical protein A4E30_00777 [Methanomassiliicoccales archaeon PtaB.Bin215]
MVTEGISLLTGFLQTFSRTERGMAPLTTTTWTFLPTEETSLRTPSSWSVRTATKTTSLASAAMRLFSATVTPG